MKALNRLVLLAGLILIGYIIWQARSGARVGGGASSSGGITAPGTNSGAPDTTTSRRLGSCAQCQGTGVVSCGVCGGKGSVTRTEQVNCHQCGGSGRYQSRVGARDSPCPFCNGTGKVGKTVTAPCSACRGTGKVPCPTCRAQPR